MFVDFEISIVERCELCRRSAVNSTDCGKPEMVLTKHTATWSSPSVWSTITGCPYIVWEIMRNLGSSSSSESGYEYRPLSGSMSQRIQPGLIDEAGSAVEESMAYLDTL